MTAGYKITGDGMGVSVDGCGLNAAPIEKSFNDFSEHEQEVIKTLGKANEPVRIRDIIKDNGWESLGKSDKGENRGSSRVRNSLRGPLKAGWIRYGNRIGDGQYQLTEQARNLLPGEIALSETIVNPTSPKPAVITVGKNPEPITRAQARMFASTNGRISMKKDDCAFYNACLDQTVSENWPGFSCQSCSAYEEPEEFQKEMDQVRLVCIDRVAEIIEKEGVSRKVGVKEGSVRATR